ncbi:MAG: hypothetical protein LKF49_00635 [Bifidobacterium tibiigranuli]|jgi:transposase|uniref:hypothetical protein n=1 Tax=Bifidobacterium tibiigranuli TaxID=2172043 RepID=UPI00235261C2|nr:hypothetical protein [Bifidobacterium tibiigranuli]MCH4202711.1 hypothetical protein [Bifidobacterium tibiigranuli]
MARRYDAEFKKRAVRLLADSRANYMSETKALEGVSKSLGVASRCGVGGSARILRI